MFFLGGFDLKNRFNILPKNHFITHQTLYHSVPECRTLRGHGFQGSPCNPEVGYQEHALSQSDGVFYSFVRLSMLLMAPHEGSHAGITLVFK